MASISWWSKDTVAVVTGANRGIGLEIVRLLAEQGLTVVLTARDKTRGQSALDGLKAKALHSVVFHQLDVSDPDSVKTLASWLKQEFGGIDILVNNAAITYDTMDYESAKNIVDTNYYGVKRVTKGLLPLLRPSAAGARIVDVTSRAGLYERLTSESLKENFRDEDKYSEELADSLATKFLEDWKTGRSEEEGWIPLDPQKCTIYSESKMFLNVYASALAKSLARSRSEGNKVFLGSVCPGAIMTDMYRQALRYGWVPKHAPNSADQGAETAVWLALLPEQEWEGKSGKFFGEKKEFPFGWVDPKFFE